MLQIDNLLTKKAAKRFRIEFIIYQRPMVVSGRAELLWFWQDIEEDYYFEPLSWCRPLRRVPYLSRFGYLFRICGLYKIVLCTHTLHLISLDRRPVGSFMYCAPGIGNSIVLYTCRRRRRRDVSPALCLQHVFVHKYSCSPKISPRLYRSASCWEFQRWSCLMTFDIHWHCNWCTGIEWGFISIMIP